MHGEVMIDVVAGVGTITLNRPKALNAVSLCMIQTLTEILLKWREDPIVEAVAIRGSHSQGVFGAFCSGGDIRFFHRAGLAGDTKPNDFFTAEYRLNHLIFTYPKPYIAFMDGVVMGGGMGLAQGASLRVVTERTRMAMPETNIGLFPDVGAGYFLSRCPEHSGEYLGLTGQILLGGEALAVGLADCLADSTDLIEHWRQLTDSNQGSVQLRIDNLVARLKKSTANAQAPTWLNADTHGVFALASLAAIVSQLTQIDSDWSAHTLAILRQRSPLMLHVTLEQIRRGRHLSLADDLRMERDLVHHCFYTEHLKRSKESSETIEGIRALVIDKDRCPKWNPHTIEAVDAHMVNGFLISPWTSSNHPLADLNGT